MNKTKILVPTLIVAVLCVLVVGQSVLKAQSSVPVVNNYAEGGIVFQGGSDAPTMSEDDIEFGAVGTRFPNGLSVGTSTLPTWAGAFLVDSTTTLPFITRDSAGDKAMTFSAAATTTPGGLFSFQNMGVDLICTTVTLDVSTGSAVGGAAGTGHPLDFSVATSTAATTYSTKSASVMATTTAATSTAAFLFDSYRAPGSYVGGDQDQGGEPWIWANGVYLLGAFDSLSTYAATSSQVYSSMVGEVQVDCYTR